MSMTKVQKKKEEARKAKQRRDFLASLEAPIITVNSPALEKVLGVHQKPKEAPTC